MRRFSKRIVRDAAEAVLSSVRCSEAARCLARSSSAKANSSSEGDWLSREGMRTSPSSRPVSLPSSEDAPIEPMEDGRRGGKDVAIY